MNKKQSVRYFEAEVFKHRKDFGLFDWEIHVLEMRSEGCRGTVTFNCTSKIASIFYDVGWIQTKDLPKREISKVAFHEICELFLGETRHLLEERYSERVADQQLHRIIRFMETKLFD